MEEIIVNKKTPSKYQQAIYDAILKQDCHILIRATAGSGKTTTIVEASKMIDPRKESLFAAFNKTIVEELSDRLPKHVACQTLHSLGMSSLMSHFRTSFKLNEFKSFPFIEEVLKKKPQVEVKDELEKKALIKQQMNYRFQMRDAIDLVRMTMTELNIDALFQMCNYYSIDLLQTEMEDVISVMKKLEIYNRSFTKKHCYLDYADMIFLPVSNPKIRVPQFDFVFIDECQDLNLAQHAFLNRLVKPKGRMVVVGDDHQCQPAGTKVLMPGLYEKSIEDLKVGDCVVGYERHNQCGFRGTNEKTPNNPVIEKIQKRKFKGELVKITSNHQVSRYTPEHICMVRFRQDKIQAQALYLMERGGNYRLGITPLWTKNNTGSVTLRAKQERADKMWILNVYENRKDAFFAEQFYSYTYGIPQLVFHDGQNHSYINQKDINEFYNSLDKDLFEHRSIELLKSFKREINYPFWSRIKKNYCSKTHMFQLEACNILGEYMQVIHFDKNFRSGHRNDISASYRDIDKLEHEPYDNFVYSLQVSKYQTYVADSILTHNCIYSFAGASIDSFERFKNKPNTLMLPLSISYRLPLSGVELAKQVYPEIEPNPTNIQGEIRYGSPIEIESGDMVLCRNNRPLVKLYFDLLANSKAPVLVGSDIQVGLEALVSKVIKKTVDEGLSIIYERLEKVKEELKAKGVKNISEHPKYENLRDKIKTIEIISNRFDHMKEVYKEIGELFKEKENCIKLMTIHRSKGLEADRVFYIERFENKRLLPSPYATQEWENIQETNLKFVMLTRHKKSLIFIQNLES